MENIFTKQIESTQDYEDGDRKRKVNFDPDSSTKARAHYKKSIIFHEQQNA